MKSVTFSSIRPRLGQPSPLARSEHPLPVKSLCLIPLSPWVDPGAVRTRTEVSADLMPPCTTSCLGDCQDGRTGGRGWRELKILPFATHLSRDCCCCSSSSKLRENHVIGSEPHFTLKQHELERLVPSGHRIVTSMRCNYFSYRMIESF